VFAARVVVAFEEINDLGAGVALDGDAAVDLK
jgi:hypothetical protein